MSNRRKPKIQPVHFLLNIRYEEQRRVGDIPHPIEWRPIMQATEVPRRVTCADCLRAMGAMADAERQSAPRLLTDADVLAAEKRLSKETTDA